LQEESVTDFGNIIRRTRRLKGFTLFLLILLIPFLSHAGPVREVSQSVERVKSIEPPLQFAILGDSRDGEKVFTQLIQKILKRDPHFIIHLGDMISRPDEKEWKRFFEISKAIDIPFFPVIGNHEVADTTRGEEIYRKQFDLPGGKTYYAFREAGALFVILDSEKGRGQILEEQRMWLDETLSSSEEKFKLVFLHRPLFPPVGSIKLGRAMDKHPMARDDLHQLFVKTGVKAVFQGDDHRYDQMVKDQILYIITGGGGAPIYALKDAGGYFHYVWVSVQKGRVEGEAVDLDGQTKDRFVIADGKGE
jgi:3',5'-cyclic AMP phosphodiesterase CpdA